MDGTSRTGTAACSYLGHSDSAMLVRFAVVEAKSHSMSDWRRGRDSTPRIDNKRLARYPIENKLHRIVRVVAVHF
jgi:hypothetical protein